MYDNVLILVHKLAPADKMHVMFHQSKTEHVTAIVKQFLLTLLVSI